MKKVSIDYTSDNVKAGIQAFIGVYLEENDESVARSQCKQLNLDFRMVELCNQFALSACRGALQLQEGDMSEAEALAELEPFSASDEFKLAIIYEIVARFDIMDQIESSKPYDYNDFLASIDLSGPQGERAQSFLGLFHGIRKMVSSNLSDDMIIGNLIEHAGLPSDLAKMTLADFNTIKSYIGEYKQGRPFQVQIDSLSDRMSYLPVLYALILREYEQGRFPV